MDKWKDRKKIHDTRICEHNSKKNNVYESKDDALLGAIFGERTGEPYQCGICKKWHLAKA